VSRAGVDPGGWAASAEGGMRRVLGLLACCLVLAGCYEAEQEFTGEIEAAALDLTQPVPGGTVYITCGPIEGVELYPLDLDPFLTIRGGYEISTMNRAIVPQGNGMAPQAFLNYEDARRLPNTNFFISGLKDGCTAVFSAVGLFIRTGGLTVSNPAEVEYADDPSGVPNGLASERGQSDESPFPFSDSRRVDQEIWRRVRDIDRTLQGLLDAMNVRRNAIVLFFAYNGAETGYGLRSSIMILDRAVFADRIVRLKG
jgi:hypothetical protein